MLAFSPQLVINLLLMMLIAISASLNSGVYEDKVMASILFSLKILLTRTNSYPGVLKYQYSLFVVHMTRILYALDDFSQKGTKCSRCNRFVLSIKADWSYLINSYYSVELLFSLVNHSVVLPYSRYQKYCLTESHEMLNSSI